MKTKKIKYVILGISVPALLFFLSERYSEYLSKKAFGRRCLSLIEDNDFNAFKKMLYPKTRKILVKNGQYKYFVMSFYKLRDLFLENPEGVWEVTIIKTDEFPKRDLFFGHYSTKNFPQPSFILQFYSASRNSKFSFRVYVKETNDGFRLVYPLFQERVIGGKER